MSDLPITAVLPRLLDALAEAPNLVLAAPPGAGKTTGVPLALLGTPWATGRIVMLEPRRLAARAAAERMAESLGEPVGQTVGYRIRGERKIGRATRIEVITEGILTRMLQSDPELSGISALLFDEIHERSIHSDLGLALALEAQAALRPDLRIVAMSATLDTARIAAVMENCQVVESAGRMHPVETRHLDRPWRKSNQSRPGQSRPNQSRARLEEAVSDLTRRALAEAEGDALVFLPGVGEITRAAALIRTACPDIEVRELHGALPFAAQRKALAPADKRRVVLATAIAETSLTVAGIRIVIDAGLSRSARVSPATGMSRLVTGPVSRAQADQRRGRAGRTAPGICYRLWTKGEEGALPAFAEPEILTTDLAPLALELAIWGVEDPASLSFLDPPPDAAMTEARRLLGDLGALDPAGRVTAHGRAMAEHPLHPRLAHMLIAAPEAEKPTAALVAAILSEGDPMRGTGEADLGLRITALTANRTEALDPARKARLLQEAKRLHPGGCARAAVAGRVLLHAYPDRVGLRRPGEAPSYLLSGGRGAAFRSADALAGQRLIVAAELEDTGREATIRLATPISEAELRAAFPNKITWEERVAWSKRNRQVEARRREMFGAIALADQHWREAPPEALGAALADGIRDRGLAVLPWSKASQLLRKRVAWLAGSAIAGLPDWSDDALLATLDAWLTPHLAGMRRIEETEALDLAAILREGLDWPVSQAIDKAAPAMFLTPLGSKVAIDYAGDAPTIRVRVQELFGLAEHPMAANLPMTIELLSPAGRPVQVTQDLPGFWQGSYRDVAKDMRARYPKHPWAR